jgi:hypothetical protein
MMKKLLIIIVIVLFLIGFAIANAPASLIPRALLEIEARGLLQEGSPKLILTETSGTVWQGKAQQAVLILNGGQLNLGAMDWSLDIWTLIQKKPVLQLYATAPGQELKATVTATEQAVVRVYDIEGRLPISVLEPWVPVLVSGEMAFVLDHIVFNPREILAIDGVLNLEYVDWLGGEYPMPLGSYMAQISLLNKSVNVQLNDFSATLGLDGQLAVAPSGNYVFNARLQPRPGLAPQVVESIKWLGKQQANGDVLINQRGRF